MPHVAHISSTLAAPLLLSISAFSCRDEHLASHAQETAGVREVPIVRSLERFAEQPEGTRVYLSNVVLSALVIPRTNREPAQFIVYDSHGARAAVALSADPSSMLWQLVPESGERRFLDFGATVEQHGGNRVLSLFKLGN